MDDVLFLSAMAGLFVWVCMLEGVSARWKHIYISEVDGGGLGVYGSVLMAL